MGAQPKPRSGVASLARHDLPSRAAVMVTCVVCSLRRASCLFSRFSSLFFSRFYAQHLFMLSNQVSRVQYCVSADFSLRQSRNCPHNCSTVLCETPYSTMPSFSIVSSGSTSLALLQLPNCSLKPADIPGHTPKPYSTRSRDLVGAIFLHA